MDRRLKADSSKRNQLTSHDLSRNVNSKMKTQSPESKQSIVEEKVLVPHVILSRCDNDSVTSQPDSMQEEQYVRRSPRKVGVKVISVSTSKSVSKIKEHIVSIKETSPGKEDDVSKVCTKKSASRKQDNAFSVTKISRRKKISTNNSESDSQEIIVSAELNSNGIFSNKKCNKKADIEVHRKTRTSRELLVLNNESSSTRCEVLSESVKKNIGSNENVTFCDMKEKRLDSGRPSCSDIVTASGKKEKYSCSNLINPARNNEPHNECSTIDQFLLMAREKLASKPHLISHMINYINSFPSNVSVLEESNCDRKHWSSDSKLSNVAISNAEHLNENECNHAVVREIPLDFTDNTNAVEPKCLSEEDNESSVVCNENSSQILSNVPEHNLCYTVVSLSDELCTVATDSGSKSIHEILEENCSVEKSGMGLEFDSKSICNNYTIGAQSKSANNVISENISSSNSVLSQRPSTESENSVLIGKSQYEVGTKNIQHKITKCSLTSDDIVTLQDITKLDSDSNHKSEYYKDIARSNKILLKTTSLRDQKTADRRRVNERMDSYKQKCDTSCSSICLKINKSNIDSANISGVDNNNAFYCGGTNRVHRIERNTESESIKNLTEHLSQDVADTDVDIKCGSKSSVQVSEETKSCRSVNSGDISSVGNLSVIDDEHTDTRIDQKQVEDSNIVISECEDSNIVITECLVNSTTHQSQTSVNNSQSTSSSELKDNLYDPVFKNTLSPPSASYKNITLRDNVKSHSVGQFLEVTSHETVENREQCHTSDYSNSSSTLNTNISSELNVKQMSQSKSSLTINGMSSKQPTKRIVLSRSFQDRRPVQAKRRFFRKVLKSVNCESVQNTSGTASDTKNNSVSVLPDLEICKTYPEVSQNVGNLSVLSKKLPLSTTKSCESISSLGNYQESSYSVKSSDSQLETCITPLKSHKEIKLSDNNASQSPSKKMRKTSSENFQCTSVVNTKPFSNRVFGPCSTKRTSDVNFKIHRRPSSVIDTSKTSKTVQNHLTNMSHISKSTCSPCSSLISSRINSVEDSNESYHDKMFHSKNPGVNIATKYKAISQTRSSRSVDGTDSASPEATSMYSAAQSSELSHSWSSEMCLQYRNRTLTETVNEVPNPGGPDDDCLSLYASSSLFEPPNWRDYSNSVPCRLSTALPVPEQAVSNTKEDRNSKAVATAIISVNREENGLHMNVNEKETLGNDLEHRNIVMENILEMHSVENNHDAEKEGFIIEGDKNSISEDFNWNVCVEYIEELNLECTQDSDTKRDQPQNKPKMHFASNNKNVVGKDEKFGQYIPQFFKPYCFQYLKNQFCSRSRCTYRHEVPDIQTLNDDKLDTILFSKQNNFQHFLKLSFDILIRTAYKQAGHELWGSFMQFATVIGMPKSQALKQIFNYIKMSESSWSPNLNDLLLLVLQENLLRDGLIGFKMLSKLGCDSFPENLFKKLIEHIISNSYDKDFMRELYDDVIVHIPLSILKGIGFVPLREFSLKLDHCGLKTEAETFNRKLSSLTVANNQETFELFTTNQSKLQVCKGSPGESIIKSNWKQIDMQNNSSTNGENEKCISSNNSVQISNQKRETEHSRYQISEAVSCDSINKPSGKGQLKSSPQNSTGILNLNKEVSFSNKHRTVIERINVTSDLQPSSNNDTGSSGTRDLRQLLNEKRKKNGEHSLNNRVVDNLTSFNISSQLSEENKRTSNKNDLRSVLSNGRSSHSFLQKQGVSNSGSLTAFLNTKKKNPVNCKLEVKRFKRNKFEKQHNLKKTNAAQINHVQNQQKLFQVPSPFMKPSEKTFMSPGMKFLQNRELNTDCNAVILQTALGTRDWITVVNVFENYTDRTESIGVARQVYEMLRQDVEISTTDFLFLMQEAEKHNMRASPFLKIIMNTIGMNVMLDLTVHEKWNEAYDIYIIMKKMEIDFHQLQVFKQEEFSPCRKILFCVQVCIWVGDMSEAVHILKDNNLISPNPNGWKVRSTKEDMKMQLELCGILFCRITRESPILMALEFFFLLLQTQGSLCNGVDLLQHSNLLMVKLLDEGYQKEALDLYSHIKDQGRGLESPTYRALLATLVSKNCIILAKHLYQTARCMNVYSYPRVKERPYHIKIYSYLMEEEIYIIVDDFLHQLAKELMIDLRGNPQVDNYRASIWIEILEHPSNNLMDILPIMLTRVDKSMDGVQKRINTVLKLFFPLHAIFGQIGHSNSIWLEPESLIICLQRILHSSHPTFTIETQ